MALLHRAELRPTKLELLADWLPSQSWISRTETTQTETTPAPGSSNPLERVAAFRFDDPDGEVGIETLIVRAGDSPVVQVPLTYRAARLEGAERWLIGTTHHSVLGQRWVYDACGDPVYAMALTTAILTGGTEAEQYYEVNGRREVKPSTTHVRGGGTPGASIAPIRAVDVGHDGAVTTIRTDTVTLSVLRRPTGASVESDATTLVATWDGLAAPIVLATAR